MRILIAFFLFSATHPFIRNILAAGCSLYYQCTARSSKTCHFRSEVLQYQNNSPDVLNVVYFRLYWNLFTENSYGHKLAKSQGEYYSMPEGGMAIRDISIIEGDHKYVPEYSIDNTLMEVKLIEPLRPGESVSFSIGFEGKIPTEGWRMGHQGRDYNIAQWYPQIATYDRYGWDKSQYLGTAEFHNEFGSFEVNVTLRKASHWDTRECY